MIMTASDASDASDEKKVDRKFAERLSGCFLVVWQGLVTLPLWFAILFMTLDAIEAPTKLWIAFYCYAPACIIGFMLHSITRLIATGAETDGTS